MSTRSGKRAKGNANTQVPLQMCKSRISTLKEVTNNGEDITKPILRRKGITEDDILPESSQKIKKTLKKTVQNVALENSRIVEKKSSSCSEQNIHDISLSSKRSNVSAESFHSAAGNNVGSTEFEANKSDLKPMIKNNIFFNDDIQSNTVTNNEGDVKEEEKQDNYQDTVNIEQQETSYNNSASNLLFEKYSQSQSRYKNSTFNDISTDNFHNTSNTSNKKSTSNTVKKLSPMKFKDCNNGTHENKANSNTKIKRGVSKEKHNVFRCPSKKEGAKGNANTQVPLQMCKSRISTLKEVTNNGEDITKPILRRKGITEDDILPESSQKIKKTLKKTVQNVALENSRIVEKKSSSCSEQNIHDISLSSKRSNVSAESFHSAAGNNVGSTEFEANKSDLKPMIKNNIFFNDDIQSNTVTNNEGDVKEEEKQDNYQDTVNIEQQETSYNNSASNLLFEKYSQSQSRYKNSTFNDISTDNFHNTSNTSNKKSTSNTVKKLSPMKFKDCNNGTHENKANSNTKIKRGVSKEKHNVFRCPSKKEGAKGNANTQVPLQMCKSRISTLKEVTNNGEDIPKPILRRKGITEDDILPESSQKIKKTLKKTVQNVALENSRIVEKKSSSCSEQNIHDISLSSKRSNVSAESFHSAAGNNVGSTEFEANKADLKPMIKNNNFFNDDIQSNTVTNNEGDLKEEEKQDNYQDTVNIEQQETSYNNSASNLLFEKYSQSQSRYKNSTFNDISTDNFHNTSNTSNKKSTSNTVKKLSPMKFKDCNNGTHENKANSNTKIKRGVSKEKHNVFRCPSKKEGAKGNANTQVPLQMCKSRISTLKEVTNNGEDIPKPILRRKGITEDDILPESSQKIKKTLKKTVQNVALENSRIVEKKSSSCSEQNIHDISLSSKRSNVSAESFHSAAGNNVGSTEFEANKSDLKPMIKNNNFFNDDIQSNTVTNNEGDLKEEEKQDNYQDTVNIEQQETSYNNSASNLLFEKYSQSQSRYKNSTFNDISTDNFHNTSNTSNKKSTSNTVKKLSPMKFKDCNNGTHENKANSNTKIKRDLKAETNEAGKIFKSRLLQPGLTQLKIKSKMNPFKDSAPGITKDMKISINTSNALPHTSSQVEIKQKELTDRLKRQAKLKSLADGSVRKEIAKQSIMGEKSFSEKTEAIRKETRTIIKGVRTNRRFELQIKNRNIN